MMQFPDGYAAIPFKGKFYLVRGIFYADTQPFLQRAGELARVEAVSVEGKQLSFESEDAALTWLRERK